MPRKFVSSDTFLKIHAYVFLSVCAGTARVAGAAMGGIPFCAGVYYCTAGVAALLKAGCQNC